MCYKVQIKARVVDVAKRFNATFLAPPESDFDREISGFSHEGMPVITAENPSVIQNYNWGLIPSWSLNRELRKNTLNARSETLNEKPTFKNSIQNRCLVIVTGFYEWRWNDAKGKSKDKYLIQSATDEILTLAGLYSHWKNPQNNVWESTFTIVTTQANSPMQYVHNTKKRMPILLQGEYEKHWLDPRSAILDFEYPKYNPELVIFKIE